MRASKYTAALLGPLVAGSSTFAEVLRKLGLPRSGGNYRNITARIRYLKLDTSHFGEQSFAARCDALTREELLPRVESSTSYARVLVELGLPTKGRAWHELVRRVRELAIDTSHFRGQGWSRGETKSTHPSVARVAALSTWTNEQVFVENSPTYQGRGLGRRLRELGWPYTCALCGISEWLGRPLVLHVDHINGVHNDNRFENLRFLCPNCHSQTPTYSNRRR